MIKRHLHKQIGRGKMKKRRFDLYFNIFGFPLSGAGKIPAGFRVYRVFRYAIFDPTSKNGLLFLSNTL